MSYVQSGVPEFATQENKEGDLITLGKDELLVLAKKVKRGDVDIIQGKDIVIINRLSYDMMKERVFKK